MFYSDWFVGFRAQAGQDEAAKALMEKRERQMRALEKAKAAETALRNRLRVILKALQEGWEFAHEYERALNGAVNDPVEEKARKALEAKKKKKESTPERSKFRGDRSGPYKRKFYSDSATGYRSFPQMPQWNILSTQQQPFYPQPFPWYGTSQPVSQLAGLAATTGANQRPPPPPPLPGTRKEPFICYICTEEGHAAKYCPKKLAK